MWRPRDKWRTIIKAIRIISGARLDGLFKRFLGFPFLEDSFFEFRKLRFSFWEGEHKKDNKKTHKKIVVCFGPLARKLPPKAVLDLSS